jgi:T5SS/PEP-CTERM-associated repeat protein
VLSNTTSFRNTSLFPNTNYFYRLRAFNGSGNSGFSSVTNAITPVLCPVSLVAWGENRAGQSTPPANLSNVVAIAAGYYQSLAIRTNHTLIGWGDGSVSPPALTGVVAIACGQAQSMALTNGGAVVCWGSNANGVSTPPASATNVAAIAAGKFHNLALRADGTVVGWGLSLHGETNPPASLNGVVAIAGGLSCSLALKSDGSVVGWGDNIAGQTNIPAGVTNAIAIAAGNSACFALRSDGTVVGWGGNSLGELNIPVGLSGVVAIGSGDDHAMALKSDGTVALWGYDPFGSLTPPVGMSAVMAIAVGEEHNVLMTCAPAIPSSLIATNLAADQIALSWTDNAWNEDGFKIERAQDSGGSPGTWGPLAIFGPNTTSYTNTSLTLNTKYWYRVRSYNAAADSGFSNQTGLPTQPSAPINLTATPVYSNRIDLAWTDLADYEDGFKIERAPDSGGAPGVFVQIAVVSSNVTAYSDAGLAGNATYWYRVRAFNSAGDSVYTTAVSGTIPLPPTAPSALGAIPFSSTRIDLAWTDNAGNENGFKVERAPDNSGAPGSFAEIATTLFNVTSYSDIGLVAATKYWYRVRAFNTGGDSGYSNQTNATTAGQNSWINPSNHKWEIASNWSAGVPPAGDQFGIVITNANTKTVTIDAATVSSNAINGCLTVSNLTVAGTVNTLQLTNAGTATPLRISNVLTLSSGALLITNAALQSGFHTYVGDSGAGTLTLPAGTMTVASNLVLGTSPGATGTVWLTGGTLIVSNTTSTLIVGNLGDGNVVVSNGTLRVQNFFLGSNQFSRGTLTIAGGSVISSNNVFVGLGTNSVGSIWLTGGEFVSTNNRTLTIGYSGTGQVTVSNGATIRSSITFLGSRSGGIGTLTSVGATNFINNLSVGTSSNGLAAVWISGGQLVSTNAGIAVASLQSTGQMTISNATVLTRDFTVASGNDSTGTLTMNGGSLLFSSAVTSNHYIGFGTGSRGSVWINSGQVVATNNGCLMFLGVFGTGRYTVSNGSVTVANLIDGYLEAGTLTVAGGSFSVIGDATLAYTKTGTVWVTGGQLSIPNGTIVVGNFGNAPLTVSNGLVVARTMIISSNSPAAGALTIPGGQVTVFDRLTVGDCSTNALGQILIQGGSLYVTNAAHTGYLDVRGGTLTINSGTLVADRLVMTNACGHFVRTGGTLSITTTNLGAGLDADGDGLPNDWEQMFGLNPLSNVGAGEAGNDGDGDGFSNLQEFQAGTDPTNSASAFRVTSVVRAGNDLRVIWQTGPGKTNALERSPGVTGSYSNNFAAIFTVTNTVGNTTNYLDNGAATNVPSFYYRVRLVP